MINLYVWQPLGLERALENGVIPDLGHAALEVVDSNGVPATYASFWPEIDTPIGELLHPFKPRTQRHPISYKMESDPEYGYMQRPAECVEQIEGLHEEVIVREWPRIRDSRYDLTAWNCSNVAKFLLLRSFNAHQSALLADLMNITVEELAQVDKEDDFWEVFRYLATRRFVNCRPEDLLRLVRSYKELLESGALAAKVPGEETTVSGESHVVVAV